MYFVYILRCADQSLYTGIALDIKARIELHRSGKGAKYVRARLPVRLVYSETVSDKSAALKREWEIKKLSKSEKEKLCVESLDSHHLPKLGSDF